MKKVNVADYNLPWKSDVSPPQLDEAYYHYLRAIILSIPGVRGLFSGNIFGTLKLLSNKKLLWKAIVIKEKNHYLSLIISVIVSTAVPLQDIAISIQQKMTEEFSEKKRQKVNSVTVKIEKIVLN